MEKIVLNAFEVDARLAKLMRREDWAASRGKRPLIRPPLIRDTEPWLEKFKSSKTPNSPEGLFAFDFLSPEQAIFNNKNLRSDQIDLSMLFGKKSSELAPGDFDPNNGYLIGLTDTVDEGIFVDLQPVTGPIITYSNHNFLDVHIATAFHSLDEFVAFYLEQHSED